MLRRKTNSVARAKRDHKTLALHALLLHTLVARFLLNGGFQASGGFSLTSNAAATICRLFFFKQTQHVEKLTKVSHFAPKHVGFYFDQILTICLFFQLLELWLRIWLKKLSKLTTRAWLAKCFSPQKLIDAGKFRQHVQGTICWFNGQKQIEINNTWIPNIPKPYGTKQWSRRPASCSTVVPWGSLPTSPYG